MSNALVMAVVLAATTASPPHATGPWVTFNNGSNVEYSVNLGSIERSMKDGLPNAARILIHREGGPKELEPYAFNVMEFDCSGHFAMWGDLKPEDVTPGTLASLIEEAACWGPKP